MITYRKMQLEDLNRIYMNDVLRPLLIIMGQGEMFAVLAEEDGEIKGGISGYRQGENAFIQRFVVLPDLEDDALMDGLIRSLIYILDREGVKKLVAKSVQEQHLLKEIGFIRYESQGSDLVLDIQSFFERRTCK